MKKMIGVLLAASLMVGCQYSEDSMNASMSACQQRGGEFQTGTTSSGAIVSTYCVFGGYRYQYSRDTGTYFDATRL